MEKEIRKEMQEIVDQIQKVREVVIAKEANYRDKGDTESLDRVRNILVLLNQAISHAEDTSPF